jgi:hypothetical protein
MLQEPTGNAIISEYLARAFLNSSACIIHLSQQLLVFYKLSFPFLR